MIASKLVFASSLLLLLSSALPSLCLAAKKPASPARSEDIPYIKCQVCEKLALELHKQVRDKQMQIIPKKVSEFEIIEIAENVCNLKKAEADWIMKIDIVEQGEKLVLVDQGEEGMCNSECKTIEKACQQILGYHDTDVAEYMYSSKPDLKSLTTYVCKDLSKACIKDPPPIPKDRIPGEAFVPKPSKDAEMEKILRSMEGMPGAPGMKMYSRDDLMNMKNLGNEEEDEDEEDDDEDAEFRRNLAKSMKLKDSKKTNWKQKISKGMKSAGETMKFQAHKLSKKISQWWSKRNAVKSEL